jgi:thiamine kinase-like enzyme
MPLSSYISSGRRADLAEAMTKFFLSARDGWTAPSEVSPTHEVHRSLIGNTFSQLRELGCDAELVDRIERELREGLSRRRWKLGLQHGDLSNSNLFVSNGALSGLIDWEHALPAGLPALDAIAYLESTERHVAGSDACDILMRLERSEWSCPQELDMLRVLYRALEIDVSDHAFLCRVAWLRMVALKLLTNDRFSPDFVARWVVPMTGTQAVIR